MTHLTGVSCISFLRGVVNGLEVQRAYTPISPGNAEGYFEVLIKVSQSIRYRLESEVLGTVFAFRKQARCQHFKGRLCQIPLGLFLCCSEAVVLCW